MRKLMLKKVVLCALMVSFLKVSVKAAGTGDVRIYPIEGSKKAKVILTVPQRSEVILSVQSHDGLSDLYRETVPNAGGYAKVYDFSQLDDGVYKLVVNTGTTMIERSFEVTGAEVRVLEESVKHLPVFIEKGEKLMINYFNKGHNQIKVEFSDGQGTFFEEEVHPELSFAKAYNIQSLLSGDYTVYFKSGDYRYSHHFNVK